jgi:hypothetical protein
VLIIFGWTVGFVMVVAVVRWFIRYVDWLNRGSH